MVFYILTGYRVLGIINLDQLIGARHTHTYLITTHQYILLRHHLSGQLLAVLFLFKLQETWEWKVPWVKQFHHLISISGDPTIASRLKETEALI